MRNRIFAIPARIIAACVIFAFAFCPQPADVISPVCAAGLPARYITPAVTPVLDQKNKPLCWAYSCADLLSINAAVRGYAPGGRTVFSPAVIARAEYDGLEHRNSGGRSWYDCTGGTDYALIAGAAGKGIRYQSDIGSVAAAAAMPPAGLYQSSGYVDEYRTSRFSYGTREEAVRKIKTWVAEFGAVGIVAQPGSAYDSATGVATFDRYDNSKYGHAMLIVGWDDGRAAGSGTGAFRVKNTWGEYGPYKQSERKPMYKPYAEQLVRDGWAYYAFDTPESLDAKRKEAEAQKKTFQYDASTRMSMVNSLTLSAEETEKRLASGEPFVVRFKYPADTDIHVHDLIRGEVVINSNLLDDKVLYKSDGMPTYHLANIVDDHTMKITHVIRGEEWLPSAPLHVMLYKAFGWEAPQFAHLPLLLKPDGNGKLSKRDGDRLGFPVFPLEWHDPKSGEVSSGYRETGYLPEAVVNMLALLGWNPGTEQEIFSLDELVNLFSLEKISKSGAKFSLDKAKWFNHEYIQMKSAQELMPYFAKILDEKGISYTEEYLLQVIDLIKDRLNFLPDFWEQAGYFFVAPTEYSAQDLKKRWKEGTGEKLRVILQLLEQDEVFDMQAAHDRVMEYIKANEWNMGAVLNSLRIGLVGAARGPELFTMINVFGVEETRKRTEAVIAAVEGR